jgi:hypothetical protein
MEAKNNNSMDDAMDDSFRNNNPMEDEDEEDYVPESLRGFLEDADKKLQDDLDDVMNFDYGIPKKVPHPDAFSNETNFFNKNNDNDEDGETQETNEIFYKILDKERDSALKADLMKGLLEDEQVHHHHQQENQVLTPPPPLPEDDDDDFLEEEDWMSPDLRTRPPTSPSARPSAWPWKV